MATKIEWTNFLPGYKGESWNPIIGCSKISPGCADCYAEKMAMRLQHMKSTSYYYDVLLMKAINGKDGWAGNTQFIESQLEKPLKWKKPRVVFVCSMGDLFHETVNFQEIVEVMHVISKCPQHIFIILTKRPHMMDEFFTNCAINPYEKLPNIWLGVTAENQDQANKRIPVLIQIPAAKKFVSIEPMLGEIDINEWINTIDWVIVGGESGSNARPMHPDWIRTIRDQCKESDTPFFFKQWGEWLQVGSCCNSEDFPLYGLRKVQILDLQGKKNIEGINACYMMKVGKKKAGRMLDGKEYNEYPKI